MGFLIKLAGKELKEIEIYLKIAVENIIEGKIIAFPTDSVYGIGGNPQNLEVIQRIYDIYNLMGLIKNTSLMIRWFAIYIGRKSHKCSKQYKHFNYNFRIW